MGVAAAETGVALAATGVTAGAVAGAPGAGGNEITFLKGFRAARLSCTTGNLFLSFLVVAVAL